MSEINKDKINEVIESILINKGIPVIWDITEEEHKAVIEELKNRGWKEDEK